jgi:hypothetical protein
MTEEKDIFSILEDLLKARREGNATKLEECDRAMDSALEDMGLCEVRCCKCGEHVGTGILGKDYSGALCSKCNTRRSEQ